jgi:hypothetical protein
MKLPCCRRAQSRTEKPLNITIIFLAATNKPAIFSSARQYTRHNLEHQPLPFIPLHPNTRIVAQQQATMAAAPGDTSLPNLLASMVPLLQPGNFVFATVPPSDTTFLSRLQAHSFEMLFRESEGWTLIASKSTAEALGLEAIFPCRKVTLGVHSSLDAVGFMAAVTTRLAGIGIGVNPVSGFYHDHLCVS